ncbi:hypothetical protein DFH09DRAFT_529600 [Mycena vulgaris]|nr:hypothetical protein DFH09DRAFT_529600 [Mycena vulgaris]
MSSPFTSKLGTNYCPHDAEIEEIKALIVEPGLRLKSLDDEITDLQRTLDKLKEEHSRLGAYIEDHRALISPVRRLPLDIIQEIFLACIPTHRNCVMSATEAPVLLGRICSSWRVISLSNPRLWSSLHITVPPHLGNPDHMLYREKLLQRLETTKAWLSRSGECSLSISLRSPYQPEEPDIAPHVHLILQALLPFTSRWEHIKFTSRHSHLVTLSHLTAADVPALKSVAIDEITYGRSTDVIQVDSFPLLGGSGISSISLKGTSFDFLKLPLRWNSLTDLSLKEAWVGTEITIELTVQLLSRCPALRTCMLRINGSPETGTGVVGKALVECAFLHTLDLRIVHGLTFAVRELFPRILFPELRHLRLFVYPSPEDGDISYAPSFFAAAPHIESLAINLDPLSRTSLIDFFRGLSPTIRKLRIEDPSPYGRPNLVDDSVLEALTPSPSSPAAHCFSGLQDLEIHGGPSFSDEALLHFIRSGMTAGALSALKRVAIRFRREIQLDILPDLQPFINAGLQVKLTYAPPINWNFSPWDGLADDPRGGVHANEYY